jgi:hypothetical protein
MLIVSGCGSDEPETQEVSEQRTTPSQPEATSSLDKTITQAVRTDSTDDWEKAFEKSKDMQDLKRVSQKMEEVEQERRKRHISSHEEIDERAKKAISEGQYFIGMTKEELRASWGSPESISKSGTTERWTYGFGIARMYFNFENGKLASVQK